MSLAEFVRIDGYKITDTFKHLDAGYVLLALAPDGKSPPQCCRCSTSLSDIVSRHRLKLKYLPVFSYDAFLVLWRRKGHCKTCKKIRSEHLSFVSEESPHLSKAYEKTLEELTEIAPVSGVAEVSGEDKSTLWRIDFRRMQRLVKKYKIPPVTHISVDEVYARKKHKEEETRNDRFFTVITDMKTRKVIWVTDSRRKEGLDAFYKKIGPEGCRRITVVAQDQHEDYRKSTMEHCKNATIVYDKFHVIKSFNEALDEARKLIIKMFDIKGNRAKKLKGKFKYILSMRTNKRTPEQQQSLKEAIAENELFLSLDLIKESIVQIFNQPNVAEAQKMFEQAGRWIWEAGFPPLKSWHEHLAARWEHVAAYYLAPTTSALSEGINNVIKTIKRRAYGYRNMEYFKLKIMQVCGYLKSNLIENQELGS